MKQKLLLQTFLLVLSVAFASILWAQSSSVQLSPGTEILQNADFSDGTNHWHGNTKAADSDSRTDFTSNSGAKGILVDLRAHSGTEVTQDIHADDLKGIQPNMGVDLVIEYSTSPDFKMAESHFNALTPNPTGGYNSEVRHVGGFLGVSIVVPPAEATHVQGSGPLATVVANPDIISTTGFQLDTTAGSHSYSKVLWLPAPQTLDPTIFRISIPAGTGSITFTKISMTIHAGMVPGQLHPGFPGGGSPGYFPRPAIPTSPAGNNGNP